METNNRLDNEIPLKHMAHTMHISTDWSNAEKKRA